MGVIISYIDKDFELNYNILRFHELNKSHTGLYIYNEFLNIINQFSSLKLSNILRYTRDNASNNITFIESFNIKNDNNIKFFDICCIAHIINIVVRDI